MSNDILTKRKIISTDTRHTRGIHSITNTSQALLLNPKKLKYKKIPLEIKSRIIVVSIAAEGF